MSDEDRNAMGHAIMRDLGPEALAGEGVSLYDAYQRAWQSALAWERGRKKVITSRLLIRDGDGKYHGLDFGGYYSMVSAELDREILAQPTEVVRVKIVEAE